MTAISVLRQPRRGQALNVILVVVVVATVAALVGAWALLRAETAKRGPVAASAVATPASSWLPKADVTGAALNLDAGGDAVVLKTASWCLPCGGEDFLAEVRAAAKTNPQTTLVVMLVKETTEVAEQTAADLATVTNVRVVSGELSTGVTEVSKAFGAGLPAVALVTDDLVIKSGMGKLEVERLIAAN